MGMSSGGNSGLEITANHRSMISKKLFIIGGKQGFQISIRKSRVQGKSLLNCMIGN
jgi:hypothetical protein